MIRIIKYCARCGKLIEDKEYKLRIAYDCLPPQEEGYCENCFAEWEALKCRQEEERRLFWEGEEDGAE